MSTPRKRSQGGVLLEMVLALGFLGIPAIAIQLETIRAVQNLVVFHWGVFEYARHLRFNEEPVSAHRKIVATMGSLLPTRERQQFQDFDRWESWLDDENRVQTRFQSRYPSFFPFLQTRRQLTRRCGF